MPLFRFPLLQCVFLLLFGISMACTSPPPEAPLEVQYAGCKAVLLPGPVCVLHPNSSRKLLLWFEPPPEAEIEIRAGGEPLDAEIKPVREGQRFTVKIPPGAERVDVLVEAAGRRSAWFLDLGPEQAASRNVIDEVDKAVDRARILIEDHRFREAREKMEGLQLPRKTPAESLYNLAYNRGLLAEGEGDYRSALTEIERAVEIAEQVLWDEIRLWMAKQKLALLLSDLGRFREADERFKSLSQIPHEVDSCERAKFLNNQGWSALRAREAGESFPDPSPLFKKALETYKACKTFTKDKEFNLLLNLALAHLQEGHVQPAKDVLARAHGLAADAPLYQKLWWGDLEARIALRDGRREEALRGFQDLEALALATSSPDGRLRAAFGQARAHEALRDLNAALENLRKAEALLDEQSLQIPVHEGRERFMATRQAIVNLHVEILLRQGSKAEALAVVRQARARMLRQLEHSDRLANLAPDQRVQWDRLLAEYREKRAVLDEQAKDLWKLLPLEQAAVQAEAEAVQAILDQAYQALGDPGRQPERTLPPSRPGELILAYHRLSRDWAGLAAEGEAVKMSRFDLPEEVLSHPESHPEELARRLLLPFRAQIERARRIRILASGPLQSVDFHGLPFQGDVLLAKRPVVYGLDLPVPTGQPSGRHALLVADPSEDLPGSRQEAGKVRQVLKSRGWSTEELKGRQASPRAVKARLAAAGLLHYAGHGIFSGLGGWGSSLPLAEGTQLTLGDLLAIQRVPAWVVLSGCDTGRTPDEAPVESPGLAHAFLLAGSRAVIASTRPAEDKALPAFFTELYRQWDGEQDFAVALQRAQLSWRQRNPSADWAGFRLFEP